MTASPSPGSPADQGFTMPAEWAPHEATWLAWPRDPLTWVAGIEAAEQAFLAMVQALSPGERVEILVHDQRQRDHVQARLTERAIDDARLHVVGHVDSWVRDYGPTFVIDDASQRLGAIDWTFDAWGGKYEALEADDRLGAWIAETAGARRFRVDAVMEGGSIDVDGQGTVLTTEQCLLNDNRNPALSQEDVERLLVDHLGVETVLWLGDGIVGDDTDGHVDDVARFVAPGTVVACVEEDPASPNHAPLQDNLDRLSTMTDARGRSLEVVELPMPRPVLWEGEPLPASYANFYLGDQAVLVPTFDDPADEEALELIGELFPEREARAIRATDLIVGMGACHCLTQQQPAL